MKSTTHESLLEDLPLFASGKTSPESSQQRTTPSDVFWAHWPEASALSNRQGSDGQTLVMCVARKGKSVGASSMPNTLEWPNDAAVFSLSQTLETGSLPPRFYLSSRACAGILRRAQKRGKELPPMLREALEMVAGGGALK